MDDAAGHDSDIIWIGRRETGETVPRDRGGAAYAASADQIHPLKTTLYGREGTEEKSANEARISVTVTDRNTSTSAASSFGPTAAFSNYNGSRSGAMGNQCHTTAGPKEASSMALGRERAQAVAAAPAEGCATAAVATYSGGGAIASGTNVRAFSWKAGSATPSLWDRMPNVGIWERIVGLYNTFCQSKNGTPPIESAGTTPPNTRQLDN